MINRFRSWIGPKEREQASEPAEPSADNVPQHIAIIMDGNGRWAKKRGMPRIVGHQSGMKAVKRATIAADELGVRYLTLYAFSTENWSRPKEEVDFLMRLPQEFLALELEELIRKNVQVRMMGNMENLPEHTLKAMREATARTKDNTGLVLNFALNYGARRELVEGIREIARRVETGQIRAEDIDQEMISAHLQSVDMPDPDLLIRTSGELRISNFMLWQIAYSELWFTDAYWPEFGREHLREAVAEYQRRTRRYGGLK